VSGRGAALRANALSSKACVHPAPSTHGWPRIAVMRLTQIQDRGDERSLRPLGDLRVDANDARDQPDCSGDHGKLIAVV
jgi:hypothetical protein